MPQHGEAYNVKMVIDGVGYDAQLKNLGFERSKYDEYVDVMQIRYIEGSALEWYLSDSSAKRFTRWYSGEE